MKSLLLWFRTFSWLFITSASQPQTFNCSRSNGDFCIIISLDFFLIHFLMPVFILVQVLGSVPLPIFFRTSNFRASVLQKWLKSSHYKSHGWFNPDLGLVKCIEFSPVLFLLLITTELFCTSNDNTILLTLSYQAILSSWWIPRTDSCPGLVGTQACAWVCLVNSNHATSLDLGLSLEKLPQPPNFPDPDLISPLQLIWLLHPELSLISRPWLVSSGLLGIMMQKYRCGTSLGLTWLVVMQVR